MSEDKALLEAAKALGVESLAPAVYRDLLAPAAREMGDQLAVIARAVRMGLAPLEAAVWGYDRLRGWLEVRITSILAERRASDIRPPPMSVAGPLLLNMAFSSEEPDLREMYAKLLASSMDRAMSAAAHPSFVALIQQLAPAEARILHHIAASGKEWPGWEGDAHTDDLRASLESTCREAGVIDLSKAEFHFDNLVRLRLLGYESSSEARLMSGGRSEYEDEVVTEHYELIELTQYGRVFLDVCVVEEEHRTP